MRIRVLNAGRHVVAFPVSDAELNLRMKGIGIEDTVPVCRMVEVLEKDNPLQRFAGQTLNMDEVNFFAKRMESLSPYERKVLSAYAKDYGVATMQDMINLTFSLQGLSLITDFSDGEQVGKRLYLDEFLAASEAEMQEKNFLEFAEKTFREGRVEVLPYGVFVEHGFQMQEIYNGKTFPCYVYSESTVAVVELQNQTGDREYLYLPTDICSMNKVKERLQVQDYWELKVTGVENQRLPEQLVPKPEDLKEIEQLTYFNELCQAIECFDEKMLFRFGMTAEFADTADFKALTGLANGLSDFEIHPGIHSDEEYGKFLVSDAGIFEVNDLLLPHIDYAGLARDRREGTLVSGRYVSGGFVGASKEMQEYLRYGGEFAEPLELDEDCFRTFRLYSPLTGRLYADGYDAGNLYRSELTEYADAIAEAVEREACAEEAARGLMHYFDRDREVAAKVLSAVPKVEEVNGELYGVLECKISEPLSERDIEVLKDYWIGQMSDGWGEGFEQHPVQTDRGEIYVSFWNSESFWSVMTAEELGVVQEQDMEMAIQ